MSNNELTVLMPVYNPVEEHLIKAVQSILTQTFTNFELLLIDDCSTTINIKSVINTNFTDNRINIIKNENNLGLIGTLNKGLKLIRTPYLARMDQDDIADKNRFSKQLDLIKKENLDICFAHIELINDNEEHISFWSDDLECNTDIEIKKRLRVRNCLAHPTALGKTIVFQEFTYRSYQKLAEDYGLWIEMAGNNKKFGKIREPLLRYRIHSTSMCQTASNVFDVYRDTLVQTKYLLHIRRFPTLFDCNLFFRVIYNYLSSTKKLISRFIKK